MGVNKKPIAIISRFGVASILMLAVASLPGCLFVQTPTLSSVVSPVSDSFFLGKWREVDQAFGNSSKGVVEGTSVKITSEGDAYLVDERSDGRHVRTYSFRLYQIGEWLIAETPVGESNDAPCLLTMVEKGRDAFRFHAISREWADEHLKPSENSEAGLLPKEVIDKLASAPRAAFSEAIEGRYMTRASVAEEQPGCP